MTLGYGDVLTTRVEWYDPSAITTKDVSYCHHSHFRRSHLVRRESWSSRYLRLILSSTMA